MTRLVAEIDFSAAGNSDCYVGEGWAEAEATHRWTMGRESHVLLPVAEPGPGCVLVINATPCLSAPDLAEQVVMLALNGRLLATVQIRGLQVLSVPFPKDLQWDREITVSFSHLSFGKSRAASQMRHGQPLGLMIHAIRVFELSADERSVTADQRLPGISFLPLLRNDVERRTGLPVQALSERFESIGQGCQFGLIQRQCGAEPLGLLRFVDTVTSKLVEGLVSRFTGVDNAAALDLEPTDDAQPRLRCRQTLYGLTYDTGFPAADSHSALVRHRQAQRLGFLRRKFFEDVASAKKIFVLTRGDCLTYPEAFAVYCALRLHGPATLLWTVFGNQAEAGQVNKLARGFLRGELGDVDENGYGSLDAWLSIMANSVLIDA